MQVHTTKYVRVVASVASAGLVVASAGFGAVYAHAVGIQHGIVLAGLTVLFAVALELVKPLAIHGALTALGSWRTWPRAVALSILGLVAVLYSLTAELSLTASSRGDLVAMREGAATTATNARERHERAKSELETLRPSRPLAELEAIEASTREHCRVYVNRGSRQTVCSKPRALMAELGRARRKQELEAALADTEGTLASTPAVKSADPGSTALATYLGTAGVCGVIRFECQATTHSLSTREEVSGHHSKASLPGNFSE